MTTLISAATLVSFCVLLGAPPAQVKVQRSSRVIDAKQHVSSSRRSSPYRRHRRYIIAELDLKPGDTVVDIGAGDGWWAQRMARPVGADGVVHAAEVSERKLARMKQRFTTMPQVKPCLCPKDGTGLPENSCDLAFMAQTYHHLPEDRVTYLRGLKKVIKPTGRLCIIERYLDLGGRKTTHGTVPSKLLTAAQASGWVLVRFELIPQTNHFLTMFVQKELFRSNRRQRPRRIPPDQGHKPRPSESALPPAPAKVPPEGSRRQIERPGMRRVRRMR